MDSLKYGINKVFNCLELLKGSENLIVKYCHIQYILEYKAKF